MTKLGDLLARGQRITALEREAALLERERLARARVAEEQARQAEAAGARQFVEDEDGPQPHKRGPGRPGWTRDEFLAAYRGAAQSAQEVLDAQEPGRRPTDAQIADWMGISPRWLRTLRARFTPDD